MRTTHTDPAPRHNARRALVGVLAVAALTAACGSSSGSSGGNAPRTSRPSTTAPGGGTVTTSSPPGSGTTASSALTSALTDTYQAETAALATYRNVVAALGPVGPFPNIIESEQQHVAVLAALFTRHGIPLAATGTGQPSPTTRSAACSLGVTIEQQVVSLYDAQLPNVSAYPDVTTAFHNLQAASRDDHLPAFQRCA